MWLVKNIDDNKRILWKHFSMQKRKVHWKFLVTSLKIFCGLKNTKIFTQIQQWIGKCFQRLYKKWWWSYKKSLETYSYAFEKIALKVFSNFIKNIDDHKRNFWKHACMQNRKVHWKFLATLLKILMMMIFVLEKFFCGLKNTIISWWRS